MTPILPPKGEPKLVARSAYLPEEMWERLTQIAEETKAEDENGKGYSRNEVMIHFLAWAIRQFEAEKKADKRAKK